MWQPSSLQREVTRLQTRLRRLAGAGCATFAGRSLLAAVDGQSEADDRQGEADDREWTLQILAPMGDRGPQPGRAFPSDEGQRRRIHPGPTTGSKQKAPPRGGAFQPAVDAGDAGYGWTVMTTTAAFLSVTWPEVWIRLGSIPCRVTR